MQSSGELASNEMTSQQIATLLAHSFPVNFSQAALPGGSNGDSGHTNGSAADRRRSSVNNSEKFANGSSNCPGVAGSGDTSAKSFKWNRLTGKY